MVTPAQTARASGFGSVPEMLVFQELERRGLRQGEDFLYQSRFFGGRLDKGGLIIDFTFRNPPDLAININGVFYHLEQGTDQIARDRMAAIQLATEGITLIFIDDDDVLNDVEFYVGEALQYRDHSRLARGF